jgi:hypothetical protein
MNSSLPFENSLVLLTAASFAATAILLLLSVLSRISAGAKARMLRVFFSFGLTAVMAGLLAQVGTTPVERAAVIASGTHCSQPPGFTFAR